MLCFGLDQHGNSHATTVTAQAIPSLTWFNSYHAYADHVKFFTDLSAGFPQNSEIFNVGTSSQGRNIFGIHLWGSGGKGSKPAVYFHGSVHAREWIAGMVSSQFGARGNTREHLQTADID